MPTAVDKVLSVFGLQRQAARAGLKSSPQFAPVYNDGGSNEPTIRVWQLGGLSGHGWSTRDYVTLAAEGYANNPDVFSCVSLIAASVSAVKWWDAQGNSKAVDPAASGSDVPIETLAQSVGRNPEYYSQSVFNGRAKLAADSNPQASIDLLKRSGGAVFLARWISDMLLSGNGYLEISRKTANGPPWKLHLKNPGYVDAEIDRQAVHEDVLVTAWKVRNGYGVVRTLSPWRDGSGDVVQSKFYNPFGGPYGMPPLQAAMLRIAAQNRTAQLVGRVMEQGAVPGWIEAKDNTEWSDEQVEALRANMARSRNMGQEMFLENAVWHERGFTPVGSGFADQSILTKRDIAAVFHVPAQLIGDATSQTYSNYKEARLSLYQEATIPILVLFKDIWNATVGMELKSPLMFDRDSFDGISQARAEGAERVRGLFGAGIITRNEARTDLEFDRTTGDGDQFYAPANFVPMSTEPAVIEDGE